MTDLLKQRLIGRDLAAVERSSRRKTRSHHYDGLPRTGAELGKELLRRLEKSLREGRSPKSRQRRSA